MNMKDRIPTTALHYESVGSPDIGYVADEMIRISKESGMRVYSSFTGILLRAYPEDADDPESRDRIIKGFFSESKKRAEEWERTHNSMLHKKVKEWEEKQRIIYDLMNAAAADNDFLQATVHQHDLMILKRFINEIKECLQHE